MYQRLVVGGISNLNKGFGGGAMASREEHCRECKEKLGNDFSEIHRLLDQFSNYPDMKFLRKHRKYLHHKEFAEYCRMKWGEQAYKAAILHIKRDCGGNVPNAVDYYTGACDVYGYSVDKEIERYYDEI